MVTLYLWRRNYDIFSVVVVHLDRCYCRYDNDCHLYKKYADQNKYFNYYSRGLNIPLKVRLKKHYNDGQKPYLDSFRNHDGRDLSFTL